LLGFRAGDEAEAYIYSSQGTYYECLLKFLDRFSASLGFVFPACNKAYSKDLKMTAGNFFGEWSEDQCDETLGTKVENEK
jgi:hypothetical protein